MVPPRLRKRQARLSREGFCPDTLHCRIHFARSVLANSSAGSVPQCFGASHRTCHARGVKHALSAHTAIPNRFLDRMLNEGKEFGHGVRPKFWCDAL